MEKKRLLEVVHAIKCSKTTDTQVATESFNKCAELKTRFLAGEDIVQEFDEYIASPPRVRMADVRDFTKPFQDDLFR